MKPSPAVIASLALISAVPAIGSPAGWELIGERTVARGDGREEIVTRPIVYASHLRLCADRDAVRFQGLDVRSRNGNAQRIAVDSFVPAGRCTADIPLSNRGARDIDRVALDYRATGAERAPRVFVFALAGTVLR